VAVAKVLLDAGFRDDGERALQLAYERNHLAMVKLLVGYGVGVSQKLFELAESGVARWIEDPNMRSAGHKDYHEKNSAICVYLVQ
jgi:hypothetical protein